MDIDNLFIENITGINYTTLSYYSEEGIERIETVDPTVQGIILSAINATLSNIKINNFNSSGEDPFFNFYGSDEIKIENVSITNSLICGGEGGSINFEMNGGLGKLILNNFTVDNCNASCEIDSTRYSDYYNKTITESITSALELGVSLTIYATDVDISNLNLINTEAGSIKGILNIDCENLTMEKVLIDNITNFRGYEWAYDEYSNSSVYSTYPGFISSGVYISSINSNISDMEINDISFTRDFPAFTLIGDVASIRNLTIYNATYIPSAEVRYDEYVDDYVTRYYDGYPLDYSIYIEVANADIDGFVVDTVTGALNTVQFDSTNVSINNSAFRNITTGYTFYVLDEDTYKNIMYEYSNAGSGVVISADNISVSNTEFEDMNLGSNSGYSGNALKIISNYSALVDNCTFRNINLTSIESKL